MPARDELHTLVDLLSEYECDHLLSAVRDITGGDRFWEGDSGLFYNEYVKLRAYRMGRHLPTAPALGHDAFVPVSVTKSYPQAEQRPLPAPPPLPALLQETLENRRSRRDYEDRPIDLGQFSALLHYGSGITAQVSAYGFENLPLRTFPTHGGLQSPEMYVAVKAVDGLAQGLYHYQPRSHTLELLNIGDMASRLRTIAYDEAFVEDAAIVFLLTGMYDRLRWKYGERAYRFLCMDAGFLAENLCLVSEGLGLGACPISGFAQDAAEELVQIDGKQELALLLLTVGAWDGRQTTPD